MTKRIIGVVVAAAVVLGLAGVAFAASSPERASYGLEASALEQTALEQTALDLAADPAPDPAAPVAAAGAKRQELQACVKPKVDAGADRKTAMRECAEQLGIKPGGRGRPGKAGGFGRAAHADLVVPKKGAEGQWETIAVDRGKVTAASADSISLQRPDGPTVTVKVVAATKVKGAAAAADLAAGRQVVVVSAGGEARSIVAAR